MRLWVKPDQLAKLGMTVHDIISAVQKQNNVNPAGQIGGPPIPKGQKFTYTVRAQGRLIRQRSLATLFIRANNDGSYVRVKDVARIELGAQDYNQTMSRLNGKPAALLGIYQLPGSNAVETAKAVRQYMAKANNDFRPTWITSSRSTRHFPCTEGMDEIVKTLVEAIILVVIVVFIFLQNWRATIIPLCACRCR